MTKLLAIVSVSVSVAISVAVAACHNGPVKSSSATCDQVADHVLSLLDSKNDRAKPVRDVFAKRCAADHWPDEARACMMDESSVHGGRHCKDRLPGTAREALDKDIADIDSPKPPQSCLDYTKAYEALAKCDPMAPPIKERFMELYKETSQRWTTPHGDRKGLDETCASQLSTIDLQLTRAGCEAPPVHSTP